MTSCTRCRHFVIIDEGRETCMKCDIGDDMNQVNCPDYSDGPKLSFLLGLIGGVAMSVFVFVLVWMHTVGL